MGPLAVQPPPRRRIRAALVAALVSFCYPAHADPAPASPATYEKDVRPLLETYCYKCHGPAKTKGDVNLARFADVPSIQRDPKLWRNVLTQLNDRNMPPENKPQPTDEERARLVDWVQHTLTHFDASHFAKDPGRVTLRRLNRF